MKKIGTHLRSRICAGILALAMVFALPAVTALADTPSDTTASVTGYTISTNHGGDNVGGTDDQYILLNVTYDRAIRITDADALVQELSVNYAGTDLTVTTYAAEQSVSADGKTLQLKFHFPFAGYAENLSVASTNSSGAVLASVVDQASGKAVSFPAIQAVVNDGLNFKTVSQTAGTSDTAASVTKSVIRLDSATRGMFHAVLLKNGVPVGTADSYNANLTSHFHIYIPSDTTPDATPAMTASDVATNMVAAITSSFGDDYTATSDGDQFTVTENTPAAGDVLDVLFVAYPRTGTNVTDQTALKDTIDEAEAADLSDYTAANAAVLKNQLAIAKSIVASTYYLQSEVDAETQTLQAALAATIPATSSNPSTPSTPSTPSNPSSSDGDIPAAAATSVTANPQTGYTSSPVSETVFVLVSAGAVLAFAASRRKRR